MRTSVRKPLDTSCQVNLGVVCIVLVHTCGFRIQAVGRLRANTYFEVRFMDN